MATLTRARPLRFARHVQMEVTAAEEFCFERWICNPLLPEAVECYGAKNTILLSQQRSFLGTQRHALQEVIGLTSHFLNGGVQSLP